MRLNLLIASIVSSILSIYFVFITKMITLPFNIILFILPVFFLLSFIYYEKIPFLAEGHAKVPITILTVFNYLAFGIFIAICIINFPADKPFEEKLKPFVFSESEYASGSTLIEMLAAYKKEFKDVNLPANLLEEGYNTEQVIKIVEDTQEQRKKISEFLKSQEIAMPYNQNVDLNEDAVKISLEPMISYFKLELAEVKKMQHDGEYEDATNEYMNSWKTADSLLKVKNLSMADALTFVAITSQLSGYYYNNQEDFKNFDFSEISAVTKNVIPQIDKAFEYAYAWEYLKSKEEMYQYKSAWPFFDYNRTMRKFDDFYSYLSGKTKNPQDIDSEFEKTLGWKGIGVYFVRNPIGEALYSISTSMFEGFVQNITQKKTEIGVYIYAINYKNAPDDHPINFKTGEKINIIEKADYLEMNISDEGDTNIQTYKINK